MNSTIKLSFILFSILFCNTTSAQLMNHGDSDFATLNMYGKHINESNNVIRLLHAALSDAEAQKELQDNFERDLYHMPNLAVIDRFTCILAHASIKSNARRMEGEIHQKLLTDLNELRAVEIELNEYYLNKTDNLKNYEAISLADLMPLFKKVFEKQQVIIDKLNELNAGYETPKFYNDINQIYGAFTDVLNSKTGDNSKSIENIHQLIDSFDFSPIEQWSYPKGMLVDAFEQIKAAMKNDVGPNDIYKQQGIPQVLNKVMLIFKNNNKEEKYIELMNPPLVLG